MHGILDEFAVGDDGSLTPLGSRTVPDGVGVGVGVGADAEGIVAF
ncbi:hypothetical protein [Kitasatospora sp. MAP5-34]|nr:hypothetical protein [Kitasatospora sp. MAP5-34]MDH6579923.1 hypothetical protein [Kitasatospora sp. MAP5-34]